MLWNTKGFEAFRRGEFGDGGYNIYVSKAGVLQRIYQYDLNRNGYFDLVYANCQNHHESTASCCFTRDGRRSAILPGQGALSGCLADITGSGYQDIVLGGFYDMAIPFSSTDIYFGSHEDYSEKRHIRIPTPWAECCTAGDFNGCGYPSLAFAISTYKVVRIFYHTECGVEWRKFVDLPIFADYVEAGDLDGDGFAELIVRPKMEDGSETTAMRIYWGGKDGIDVNNFTEIPAFLPDEVMVQKKAESRESDMEKRWDSARMIKCVQLDNRQLVSCSSGKKVVFFGVDGDRNVFRALELDVPQALSVAVGDINGDGVDEIAVACTAPHPEASDRQASFIFVRQDGVYHAYPVETRAACDVVIADWDKNGRGEVIFAQGPDAMLYSNKTRSYIWQDGKFVPGGSEFECEDVRRIFFVENPGKNPEICIVNHHSRRAVGFDKSFVYFGGPDGYSSERRLEVPCWCAVDSICADVDDDGIAELVICNNSENSMHLDPGNHIHHFDENGNFCPEKTTMLPVDLGWGGICADFDRDGHLDFIFSANQWSDLYHFHGNGDGTYRREKIEIGAEGGIRWFAAADLNKNGYLDLIIPVVEKDRTYILHGGPEGFSMDRRTDLGVFNGVSAKVADLTGNGYGDVIIGAYIETPVKGELTPHQPHQSFVYIYWNDGNGLRENNRTVLKADGPVAFAVADFNNDGFLDLFVSNYHSGKERDINSIIYWNREGRFSELDRKLLFGHSASGCIAADFNEDGYIDLAVANHKVDGDHHGYSTVWWNSEKGFSSERCSNLPTEGPHGMTMIEPGNVLTRGPEEYYYSEPFTVTEDAELISIDVVADIPPKTWVKAVVRKADNADALKEASWLEPGFKVKEGEVLQYRLELGAYNSLRTPRVTEVNVKFRN